MTGTRNALFVTGTDTGVGKTVVACAIVAALRARGRSVGVLKPVETGCDDTERGRRASDAELLRDAAGGTQPADSACSYRFVLPAAPLVAAEHAGTRIDPLRLLGDLATLRSRYDIVVVEGAGGLMVPIAEAFTYLDFVRDAAIPVLCVVGSRLGCINHTLLTLHVAMVSGLRVAGYCTNVLAPGDAAREEAESNHRTIGRFTGRAELGIFGHVEISSPLDAAALAAAAERCLDLDALERVISG